MRTSSPLLLLFALCACGGTEDRVPEPDEVQRFIAKMEADEARARATAIRQSRALAPWRGDAARARTAIPNKKQN
jgi:hypothetical protein